jgi:ParB family protein of integrating conjugative element (PFGI_1 class)
MAAKNVDANDIKGKLLQGAFTSKGPAVTQLSDPIADTPMVMTLDRLRPYEHNPRINRNPMYDEIKASILNRGLEAPPPITRRPGEEHYIIRNGGNTRLAILNELWAETRDERFFRINCLFRPWPERGDIVALTGHLAENDMHGELTFVERALGIDHAREFYERESGQAVSQRELARLLAADGYPVSQPHISKMQDTLHHLLPAIPNILYGGLGKPQIEKLIALRRGAEKTWQQHADDTDIDFDGLFLETLSTFDGNPHFSVERFQDELIHQMQQPLNKDYNWLKLDILESRRPDKTPPVQQPRQAVAPVVSDNPPAPNPTPAVVEPEHSDEPPGTAPLTDEQAEALIQAHVVTPIPGLTPRTQAMKRQVAQATGEPIPDFDENCLQAIPIQVGGLHPVSDLWYIEWQIDEPTALRQEILGLASDIAEEVGAGTRLCASEWGIGFTVTPEPEAEPSTDDSIAHPTMQLLDALSTGPGTQLELGQLMLGNPALSSQPASMTNRLSDQALVKIFRIVRLARRLIELEVST